MRWFECQNGFPAPIFANLIQLSKRRHELLKPSGPYSFCGVRSKRPYPVEMCAKQRLRAHPFATSAPALSFFRFPPIPLHRQRVGYIPSPRKSNMRAVAAFLFVRKYDAHLFSSSMKRTTRHGGIVPCPECGCQRDQKCIPGLTAADATGAEGPGAGVAAGWATGAGV